MSRNITLQTTNNVKEGQNAGCRLNAKLSRERTRRRGGAEWAGVGAAGPADAEQVEGGDSADTNPSLTRIRR